MIITDDKLEKAAPLPTSSSGDSTNLDTPPPYSRDAAVPDSPAETNPSDTPDALERPCNWMYIERMSGRIKERYTIDPSLQIPSALLSDAVANIEESKRDNLNLNTMNGAVDVTIHIVNPSSALDMKRRVRISLTSMNGSVAGKIVSARDIWRSTLTVFLLKVPMGDISRPKFIVSASTCNGSIKIYIPRSFRGPISATTTWGSIQFSAQVERNVTMFADGSKKKCFVGDFSSFNDANHEEWDELKLTTMNGSVRIYYADEDCATICMSKGGSGKGLLGKIFGL
ncbi:hypothetical protein CCMSSC00406_0010245 [Pleurotus cornucopiae]|uniref:Uncharacterized protein n=1 Tax=Pleurotus cornucopiae TaxID=5321 RepID=A0ACB7IJP9_PLECO|nr:hypothetical protein CCMSSC00406_0010245 [Pleurotus cornucopiae]